MSIFYNIGVVIARICCTSFAVYLRLWPDDLMAHCMIICPSLLNCRAAHLDFIISASGLRGELPGQGLGRLSSLPRWPELRRYCLQP